MNFRARSFRPLFFLTLGVSVCLVAAAAEKPELKTLKKAPAGLSDKITAVLDPAGFHIDGPEQQAVEIWLARDLAAKSGFTPGLYVKYPFTPGQLIGAIRIPDKAEYNDFRGQDIKPGVYILRYGQQPQDGNHIGTSATSDFLLALPAKIDTDPKPIAGFDELARNSSKSVSSTHPAIFSMLPVEKASDKPTLTHDENHNFWILNVTADAKANDKDIKVPLRFVVFGRGLE